jgi:hypothetical protein
MRKFVAPVVSLVLALSLSVSAVAQAPNSAHGDANPGQVSGRPHEFMERANPEAVERAIKAQERHTKALKKLEGVHGTGVSWRADGETVIVVYTERPSPGKVAVRNKNIPQSVDGIPVVVEAVGPFYALNIPCERRKDGVCGGAAEEPLFTASAVITTERQPRPVPIGISVGHVDVTAGTLGCRVSNGCHRYALSNAHVFANENAGQPGDTILQPGVFDGGTDPDDYIATLYQSAPIVMSTNASNRIDAAIADIKAVDVARATPPDGYGEPLNGTTSAIMNLDVMKYGRTTRLTHGYISAVNVTVDVGYEGGTAQFVQQILIRENDGGDFSRFGDSGALIVASGGNKDRKAVGLLFASGTGITVANPINFVLDEFGVAIDGD